jgi:ParB-like chromosome segregation protein Spo0J
MSTRQKIQEMLSIGFSKKTLLKLNESQLTLLHKRMVGNKLNEATTKQEDKNLYKKKSETKEAIMVKDPAKALELQRLDPNAKIEVTEKKQSKKKNEKNPWAICTTTMGEKFGTTERSEWTKKEKNKYEKPI